MKHIKQRIIERWRLRKRYEFADMPTGLLAAIGLPSALASVVLFDLVRRVGPLYSDGINQAGLFNMHAVLLGALLACYAIAAVLLGVVAKRCLDSFTARYLR